MMGGRKQTIRRFEPIMAVGQMEKELSLKTPLERSKGKVILSCEVCGLTFERKASEAKRNNHHYCGMACRAMGAVRQVEVTCRNCMMTFYVKPSHVGKVTCCSEPCRRAVISSCTSEMDKRMWADGSFGRGEDHVSAKLTAAQVAEIRMDERPSPAVAKDYGVTKEAIKAIRRGKTWRSADAIRSRTE